MAIVWQKSALAGGTNTDGGRASNTGKGCHHARRRSYSPATAGRKAARRTATASAYGGTRSAALRSLPADFCGASSDTRGPATPVKIRVLSDLHLEFSGWRPPPCDEDVVVLAGDIAEGRAGIAWARKYFRDRPIVYVPGNHEYYGRDFDELREGLRESGRTHDVHVLDGDEVIVDGVRFLGATLWTDFEISGSDLKSVEAAMRRCQKGMTDFHVIRRWGGALRPEDTREIHQAQRDWLQRALAGCTSFGEGFAGPTVVVTHHAPCARSIAPRFAGDPLNPAFACDVTDLMGPAVQLWIHGHTHNSSDYIERGTRVISNPRGYMPYGPNPDFDQMLIVEVPT